MSKYRGLKSKWARLHFKRIGAEPSDSTSDYACSRCGFVVTLLPDPITHRLDFLPCVQHLVGMEALEGIEQVGSKRPREDANTITEAEAVATSGLHIVQETESIPPCSKGLLEYDQEAAWYEVRAAEAKEKEDKLAVRLVQRQQREQVGSSGVPNRSCTPELTSSTTTTIPDAEQDRQLAAKEIAESAESLVTLAKAILNRSSLSSASSRSPPAAVIGLLNPKTPANYGAILRACGCYCRPIEGAGATNIGGLVPLDVEVIVSGSRLGLAMKHQQVAFASELGGAAGESGKAQQGNRAPHGAGVARTDTMAAGLKIQQRHLARLEDFAAVMDAVREEVAAENDVGRKLSVQFVAVDMIDGAQSLPLFSHYLNKNSSDVPYPQVVVYLFGPEDGSIPAQVVDACDAAVYVTTEGSLNLSATVNVLLYDRLCKWEQIRMVNEESKSQSSTAAEVPWLLTPPVPKRQRAQPNSKGTSGVFSRNTNNKTHF